MIDPSETAAALIRSSGSSNNNNTTAAAASATAAAGRSRRSISGADPSLERVRLGDSTAAAAGSHHNNNMSFHLGNNGGYLLRQEEVAATAAAAASSSTKKAILMQPQKLQKLSLVRPNAPCLQTVTAPFAKTTKKRALISASFYSECAMSGIPPITADMAAIDIQNQYERWWKKAKYHNQQEKHDNTATTNCKESLEEERARSSNHHHNKNKRRRRFLSSSVEKAVAVGGGSNVESSSSSSNPIISTTVEKDNHNHHRRVATGSTSEKDDESTLSTTKVCLSRGGGASCGPQQQGHSANTTTAHTASLGSVSLSSSSGTAATTATANSTSTTAMMIREITLSAKYSAKEIQDCKKSMLQILHQSGGDTECPQFRTCLQFLSQSYTSRNYDARWTVQHGYGTLSCDGDWLTLSKPTYDDCLGRNVSTGEYQYTLGRLSFDMFRPTTLLCSVQGIYNRMDVVTKDQQPRQQRPMMVVPVKLQKDITQPSIRASKPAVRNYDIVVALTIEARQTRKGEKVEQQQQLQQQQNTNNTNTSEYNPDEYVIRRPIHALLTNHGYCIPDPQTKNRLSIWFTGGSFEPVTDGSDDDELVDEWKHLFDPNLVPNRSMSEFARVLATRILLGAKTTGMNSDDGTMSYSLSRPIGGHNQVFCDVLYADDSLRILQGHHGSIFVFTRCVGSDPNSQDHK